MTSLILARQMRAPLEQLIRRARGSSRNVVLFIDSTPRAGAGCPRSLARPAARWWLRGTKKKPRREGRAGASRGGRSQTDAHNLHMLAYKDLTRRRDPETALPVLRRAERQRKAPAS